MKATMTEKMKQQVNREEPPVYNNQVINVKTAARKVLTGEIAQLLQHTV